MRIIANMSASPSAASIIVPVFREVPNVQPLVERVFAALASAHRDAELILVDDNSQDGTEEAVASLKGKFPVRLIVRRTERGLSSAVLAGFAQANFDRFVVLDGDLQHPPELIPTLLDHLDREDCDFVTATRYGQGGGIAEDWPLLRRFVSRMATMLARPLAPVSDPMSGFFAIRRETWQQAAPLNPIGYKIALELYVKARCRSPQEVPIRFEVRAAGESKLSFAEQVRYLRHLARLYHFRFPCLMWSLILIGLAGAVALVYWMTDIL